MRAPSALGCVVLFSLLGVACGRHHRARSAEVVQPAPSVRLAYLTPGAPQPSDKATLDWATPYAERVENPYEDDLACSAPSCGDLNAAATRSAAALIHDPWVDLPEVTDGRPSSLQAVTADTDPRQARDGVARPPQDASAWCTQTFGSDAKCRVLANGPLYLTDVFATGSDCRGQTVAVLRRGKLRLHLRDPNVLRGARLTLAGNDSLVLVQTSEPASAAAEPATTTTTRVIDSRYACDFYWSGFAPYGMRPSSPVDVAEVLDY